MMETALIAAGVVYLGLALASGNIAHRKGRSGTGWFILNLIFPFAILFVTIATPIEEWAPARPSPPCAASR